MPGLLVSSWKNDGAGIVLDEGAILGTSNPEPAADNGAEAAGQSSVGISAGSSISSSSLTEQTSAMNRF